MKDRHLFLFGGSPPFGKKLGERFAELSLYQQGKVAILFIEREGWQEYMKKYTQVLEMNGIEEFCYLPLSQHPLDRMLSQLETSTGMIIGGGATELYRQYIVDTKVGIHIKEMYKQGIPVAGFSAGALICPTVCVIPPIDTPQNKHLFLKGLGLLKNSVISVHYSKWNEEENLKTAMKKTNLGTGYGINDDTGLYFKNENLMDYEGARVYKFLNDAL